ncbi:MAG: acyl-CoA synthetase (AMP-forming)/AMP-acid ligase II, partial [Alteromonadaceae bacterium]
MYMMENVFISALVEHAATRGNDVACHFLDAEGEITSSLTFDQLLQTREMAKHILTYCQPGDRALLIYENGAEFMRSFLACLQAGVIAVPAYPPRKNQNVDRLRSLITDAECSVVLTVGKLAALFADRVKHEPAIKNIPVCATDELDDRSPDITLPQITPETVAFLQYSSGSTGDPKGVMVNNYNLVQNIRRIEKAFEQDQNSRIVSWLPNFHDMGLIAGFLMPVYLGAQTFLMSPTTFLNRPVIWLKAVAKYKATMSGAPNFAYDLCVDRIKDEDLKDIDLKGWKVAFCGAEPIRAETFTRFSERFSTCGFGSNSLFPCYGMAEATLFISGPGMGVGATVMPVEKKAFSQNRAVVAKPQEAQQQLVSSGILWLGDEIAIADPQTRQHLPDCEVGEVWFRSPSVAQGYWKNPELTEYAFNAHLSCSNEGPFMRTGDLGFMRDGMLYITGRLKDIIIIRGGNFYPQDIEKAVSDVDEALAENSSAAFSVD